MNQKYLISIPEAQEKVARLWTFFESCCLCPRVCRARRKIDQKGSCQGGADVRIASWATHQGEEPPISGKNGSGTIFTSFCSMKCVFCQNFPFSQLGNGKDLSVADLSKIMLSLEARGAHNINFVNPGHFLPHLFQALLEARVQGLSLPLVYNSSGYERTEVLEIISGMVDIFLPDIRYSDNAIADEFSGVSDYVQVNRKALIEMRRQVGNLQVDPHGIGTRGIIVRHLVLPENLAGSRESLTWLKEELGQVHLSIMCQYFPAYKAHDIPPLNRKIFFHEYYEVLEIVENLGFENVWAQDPDKAGGA